MEEIKSCFIIMPFSQTEHHSQEYWTNHFEYYLKPLIEKTGKLSVFRSEPLKGNIASQIITDLINSYIVVADLTDHNPNVLWELGVRQSYKHCTITIAEKGTKIPFHFSHKGILEYNGDHLNNQYFEEQLSKALDLCMNSPEEPDSPILEAIGGRGSLYSIIHEEENNRKLKVVKQEIIQNEKDINYIYILCEKNKGKKPGEREMLPYILNIRAIQNLYINRYLDKPDKFYDVINSYIKVIDAFNNNIHDWVQFTDKCEKWFISNKKEIDDLNNEIKKLFSI
jgi:hypothetical protein